jgi:hypothetical protein
MKHADQVLGNRELLGGCLRSSGAAAEQRGQKGSSVAPSRTRPSSTGVSNLDQTCEPD